MEKAEESGEYAGAVYISSFDRTTSFHEREENRSDGRAKERRRREGSGCFSGKIYNPTDRL